MVLNLFKASLAVGFGLMLIYAIQNSAARLKNLTKAQRLCFQKFIELIETDTGKELDDVGYLAIAMEIDEDIKKIKGVKPKDDWK